MPCKCQQKLIIVLFHCHARRVYEIIDDITGIDTVRREEKHRSDDLVRLKMAIPCTGRCAIKHANCVTYFVVKNKSFNVISLKKFNLLEVMSLFGFVCLSVVNVPAITFIDMK